MNDGLKELRWLRGLVAERDGHGGDIPVWLALEWIDDAIKRAAHEPKAPQNAACGMCQLANRPACDSYPRCQCGQTLPRVQQGGPESKDYRGDALTGKGALNRGAECQHDLLRPNSTIDVRSDGHSGTCTVCKRTWDLAP